MRNVLTLVLVVCFVGMGVAESVRALTGDGSPWWVLFWGGSLIGGAALVLVGRSLLARSPRLAVTLVAVGCLAGANATVWTLVLPCLAVAVLVLTVRDREPALAGQGT